ncbi:MAG: YgiT-type zinc finger protein [bacterium]|nr:YgiT-type zinc finger protein [bacterium]
MKIKEGTICKSCKTGKLKSSEVSQTFERGGLEVKIEGIPALVCDKCGQVYFPPGISDKIVTAANDLFALSEIKHSGMYKAVV